MQPLGASSINQKAIGTCPHGMPPGACPICNGMGGGGGSKKADFSAKSNEMSWNECYAIGQLLKANKENAEMEKKIDQNMFLQNTLMAKVANNIAQAVSNMKSFIMNSQVVQNFSKISNAIKTQVKSALNVMKNALVNVKTALLKPFNAIKSAFVNISDKLAAVFGEKENALNKLISDNFDKAKKKIFSLLGFVSESQGDDEEAEEIKNEKKRISHMEKLKTKLLTFLQTPKEQA